MAQGYLDDAARTAFAGAIAAVETTSSAEIVVAIRARARVWLHAHLAVGVLAAWIGLGFMLYADHPFGLVAFLIDPLLVGALAALASTLSSRLVRALTPATLRRRAVLQAARATFYERGVHHTAQRTGVLVYIAVTEGQAELVADDGVVRAVAPSTWQRLAADVDVAVGRGGVATAQALAALAPVLALALPRHVEDVNELPDAIDDGDGHARPAARPA